MFDFLNRRLDYMADGIREGVTDLGTFTVPEEADLLPISQDSYHKNV